MPLLSCEELWESRLLHLNGLMRPGICEMHRHGLESHLLVNFEIAHLPPPKRCKSSILTTPTWGLS